MEVNQALEVLDQAINVALSAGAFKSTKDVTVIAHALEVVRQNLSTKEEPEMVTKKSK